MVNTCLKCSSRTLFREVCSYANPDELRSCEYTLGECLSCHAPSLFSLKNWDEIPHDEIDNVIRDVIYPISPRKLGFKLPPIVESSYNEAVICERAAAYTACVVMVGRALEALCKEIDPTRTERNLNQALSKLKDDGIISNEIFEWSNHLRVLRNFGAHANEEIITADDASESVDFLQAIAEILYDLRPKFERMKKRHNK